MYFELYLTDDENTSLAKAIDVMGGKKDGNWYCYLEYEFEDLEPLPYKEVKDDERFYEVGKTDDYKVLLFDLTEEDDEIYTYRFLKLKDDVVSVFDEDDENAMVMFIGIFTDELTQGVAKNLLAYKKIILNN